RRLAGIDLSRIQRQRRDRRRELLPQRGRVADAIEEGTEAARPAVLRSGHQVTATAAADGLRAAGLDQAAVAACASAQQQGTTDLAGARERYGQLWRCCDDLLLRLPPKPKRNEAEAAAAHAILADARAHRERFLAAHGEALYDRITRG